MHCITNIIKSFSFSPLPTVEPVDYTGITEVLTFAACATRECRTIVIIEDDTAEDIETFNVTLTQTNSGLDLRITLEPVDAVVEIIDANSKY